VKATEHVTKWKEDHPVETAEYFYSLNPDTLLIEKHNPSPSDAPTHSLTHRDIYIGIDVWGRGSRGGGGFRVHKALEQISPDSLGLSVAIFGPGWTWEKRQDETGRTWKAWWDEDVTLWTGKASGLDLNKLLGIDTTPFRPIGDFFVKKPPPDPKVLPFFTTLCPGVGKGWWVAGGNVWDGLEGDDQRWTSGWLDVEKCYSIGDSLWPVPTVVRDEVQGGAPLYEAALPTAQVSINLSNAWNGGSSVQLSFSEPEPAKPEQAPGDRSFWVPVQSFSLTPEENYTATAVYKLDKVEKGVVVGVRLEIRRFRGDVCGVPKGIYQDESRPLGRGWSGLQTCIKIHANDNTPIIPVELALGLRFNVKGCASANQQLFSLLLGQVIVNASQQVPQAAERIAVDFKSHNGEESVPKTSGLEGLDGILTWREIASVAEPTSLYGFAYWNVYVLPLASPGVEDKGLTPGNAMWIGTSGVGDAREGELGRFAVTGRNLMTRSTFSGKLETAEKLRFYVQAVAACGETGGGNTSSYVDVGIKQPT
jgi:mannosyl-glycoprotein endo-beta-N-acetylglucosaminidase